MIPLAKGDIDMGKAWWRPDEVASLLAVSMVTVYRWMRQGDLPRSRIKGVLRVADGDLQAFINRGKGKEANI